MGRNTPRWEAPAETLSHLPAVSGNTVNRLDEDERRPPSRFFWHDASLQTHGELQKYVVSRFYDSAEVSEAFSRDPTDLPLLADEPDVFGADDFCHNCRLCTDACPSEAIVEQKQLVRGDEKWCVDFDRCIPYYAETKGCAICIARCPSSRPGVADNLLVKMARRREHRAAAES